MEQSCGKLNHWLAFYLCKGLGIKTLLAPSQQYSLASLFSLSQSELVTLGLTAHQASNLLNTNWQQVVEETLRHVPALNIVALKHVITRPMDGYLTKAQCCRGYVPQTLVFERLDYLLLL